MEMYREREIEPKITELIRNAEKPVTIGWVAKSLGIAWGTARSLIQNMNQNKQLKAVQTSRAIVYQLN